MVRTIQGRLFALLLGTLAFTASGAGAQPAMAPMPAGAMTATSATNIEIKNFDFSPMAITIPAGGSVTWKNLDEEPHTVTSADGMFRSGALDENESFTFKFDKPGVYTYLCSIHPKMRATITVR